MQGAPDHLGATEGRHMPPALHGSSEAVGALLQFRAQQTAGMAGDLHGCGALFLRPVLRVSEGVGAAARLSWPDPSGAGAANRAAFVQTQQGLAGAAGHLPRAVRPHSLGRRRDWGASAT